MIIATPLQILESELSKLVKAKRKSREAFEERRIPKELHDEHVNNLNPKIKEFHKAIEILKNGLK